MIFILHYSVQEYWDHKFRNVSDHTDTMLQNTLMISLTDGNSTGVIESDTDEKAKTPLQLAWNSYLSISNMIPNLGMLLLNATMGHKMPMRPRLLGSLIGIIILFVVTDIMTQVNTDSFQTGFLHQAFQCHWSDYILELENILTEAMLVMNFFIQAYVELDLC